MGGCGCGPDDEMPYPWSIGNDRVRFRYVDWRGEARLFMDVLPLVGHVRVFRVRIEEIKDPAHYGETPEGKLA